MTFRNAVSAAARVTSRSAHAPFARVLFAAVATLALLAGTRGTATAQDRADRKSPWEFRVSSGALVPTGAQRRSLELGALTAGQVSFVVRPSLAVTATLGWARSRDLATAGDPQLDVFSYDLGAELRGPEGERGRMRTFRPFAVAGVGARSYDHRHLAAEQTRRLAVYAGGGGELAVGRVALRLEARDVLTRYEPLADRRSAHPRNDVVLLAGLRFVSR